MSLKERPEVQLLKRNKSNYPKSKNLKRNVYGFVFVLLIALGVTITLVRVQGFAPLQTIYAGLEYSLGSVESIASTIAWGLPLVIAALGVSIAFRSGMFNIGAEGQIYAGAMAAALVGAYLGPLFSGLHLFLT